MTSKAETKFRMLLAGNLFGDNETFPHSQERQWELAVLRGIYIPELVMWLHQMLFQTRSLIPGYN